MSQDSWSEGITLGGREFPYGWAVIVAALVCSPVRAGASLAFATLQESASPGWPASGFAVAFLILAGPPRLARRRAGRALPPTP